MGLIRFLLGREREERDLREKEVKQVSGYVVVMVDMGASFEIYLSIYVCTKMLAERKAKRRISDCTLGEYGTGVLELERAVMELAEGLRF